MQAFILSLVLTFLSLPSLAAKLGSCEVTIKHSNFDLYGDKGEDVEFIIGGKPLLIQTLDYKNGKCRAESYQKGNYEIEGDKLRIFLYWDYLRGKGVYDAPYGAQIITYRIDKECTKLTKVSSKVYIESHARDAKAYDDGMKFLFQKPKTKEEQESLQDYISKVEHEYKGDFVTGEAAKEIIDEVQKSFFTKAQNRWRSRF